MPETRAEQLARIRRHGLLLGDLELELIRAEQRGAQLDVTEPPRRCLARRVLEYLGSYEGTTREIAMELGAGLNQTHRAVQRLLVAHRIRIVRTIETTAHFGRSTRVLGIASPAPPRGGGCLGSSDDFTYAGERGAGFHQAPRRQA